ncbi:MAG: PAS domain S-box protein [Methanothrix sp.]|nr:PAS domain S-box protein [Methanothrix sp.]
MLKLADLVASNEDWLMHKVLSYAKDFGYTRYTSTLAEAWRASISGLSQSLLECLKHESRVQELLPDENYANDPVAAFGIIEAKRHRDRGVSLGMFLGLMKYYRQSYIDLVEQAVIGCEEERQYCAIVNRFFDRIELGFCTEWNNFDENQSLADLQYTNRRMTNEKNRYLTIFESISDPIIIFNRENRIENMNHSASKLLLGHRVSGHVYYDIQATEESLPWIAEELSAFDARGQMEAVFEKLMPTEKGMLQFQVKIKNMLDVSEKFSGKVVILNDITERKHAECALRESEMRLRTIFDTSSAGIIIVDTTGRIAQANHRLAELFACPLEKMIGKTYPEFIHPDERHVGTGIMQAMMENRVDTVHTERHYLRDDGSDFWGYMNGRRMVGSKGEFMGLLGIISDISDYKRTEDELRRKTALFEAQIEATSDGILVVDDEGRRIITNHKLLSVLKVPSHISDEINDEALLQYVASKTKDPDQFLDKVRHLYDHKDEIRRDEIEFNDGIVMDRYSSPVIGKDGEYYGRIWTFHDVTDYKHTLGALRDSEQRLSDIIDFLPDATFAVDREGAVIAWNRAIEEMTGVAKADIMGKSDHAYAIPFYGKPRPILIDLIFVDDEEMAKNYYFVSRKGDQLIAETIVPLLNGKRDVFLWGIASPLYDSSGSVMGAIESIRDISRYKKAEEDLQLTNRQLEIASQHAETMARQAELANAAKSEFLANMSHEIRTPMNAVIGMTNLLLYENLNSRQKEYVETIRNSGEALLDIINNILDLSKIEGGMMELEHQPFDLQSTIKESLRLVAAAASEKGLNLTYHIDENVPSVILGDPTRLRQILINLISNAVKFTEMGGVTASVFGRKLENDNFEIHFSVKDTGIGIPKDKLDRLFQSFSQVDASTTRRYGGTGLGLAICRKLVEMMGGKIWVESEAKGGCTFHFIIQAETTDREPIESGHAASCGDPDIQGDLNHDLRILIAEDNKVNQMVTLRMLSKLGCVADVASSGIEVLKALERRDYDLILMDVLMPEMDGLEATKAIRERWHDGPMIIAMTASALQGDRDKCISAGMDSYLSKPATIEDLKHALLFVTRKRKQREETAACGYHEKGQSY